MKLRITAGLLSRRYITIPSKATDFRPTAERTRQAVANILSLRIKGAKVADCCAGSGAFGFELLSRGAEFVVFVENNAHRVSALKTSAETLGLENSIQVYSRDLSLFIKSNPQPFNIILYDPPYFDEDAPKMCGSLFGLLDTRGILVYERAAEDKRPVPILAKELDSRRYGDTMIDLFVK
jgi:16S rRNA (guanine966-N2)-methyltransferase